VLTTRIRYMTLHAQKHNKDFHNKCVALRCVALRCVALRCVAGALVAFFLLTLSLLFCRRGLLMMVEKRRKLLQYLKRKNFARCVRVGVSCQLCIVLTL
jgi:ribosomal protein S15P/S13E